MAALGGEASVVAGGAEVVAVADHADADAESRGPVACLCRGLERREVTEPGVGVDHDRGAPVVADDLAAGVEAQAAGGPLPLVGGQHGDAVGVDATEVGVDHDLGGPHGRLGGHPPARQHLDDLALQNR